LEEITVKGNSNIILEEVIYKGAEASLFKGKWFDKTVLIKQRIPKKYRIVELDDEIRRFRTVREAKMLIAVKDSGIPVPQVYEIDLNAYWIVMKYIPGNKLKNLLHLIDGEKRRDYFKQIGRYIALMHKKNYIHGDLTTSNIIITENENIFFVDFGLSNRSDSIEDKSVDLHLFKRVLMSTHGSYFNECYDNLLGGYEEEYGKDSSEIIERISVIESRGRYIEKEERKK
jgi:Kae1-associated kinase Bud32